MTMQQEEIPCYKCKRPGERKMIEILPDKGRLWRVVHEDGMVCEWTRYKSFEDMQIALGGLKRAEKSHPQIICPECGGLGYAYNKKNTWYVRHNTKGKTYEHTMKNEADKQVVSDALKALDEKRCIKCGKTTWVNKKTGRIHWTGPERNVCHNCYEKNLIAMKKNRKESRT